MTPKQIKEARQKLGLSIRYKKMTREEQINEIKTLRIKAGFTKIPEACKALYINQRTWESWECNGISGSYHKPWVVALLKLAIENNDLKRRIDILMDAQIIYIKSSPW